MDNITSFTKTGMYHSDRNMSNEDRFASFENRYFRGIAIADGVSTCTQSRTGAQIAVDTVMRIFRECGAILWEAGDRKIRNTVFNEVLYALRKQADRDGIPVSEYSSTLAFAILHKKSRQLLLFSLGDSTILLCEKDTYRIASAPQAPDADGIFTTTTEGGDETAYVKRGGAGDGKVLLFTDGGWNVAEKLFTETTELKDNSLCETLCRKMMAEECWDDSSFISAVL